MKGRSRKNYVWWWPITFMSLVPHGPMRVFTGMPEEHSVSFSCHEQTGVWAYTGCAIAWSLAFRFLCPDNLHRSAVILIITGRSDQILSDEIENSHSTLQVLSVPFNFKQFDSDWCIIQVKMKRYYRGRLPGRRKDLPTGLGHAPFELLRSPPKRAPGKWTE